MAGRSAGEAGARELVTTSGHRARFHFHGGRPVAMECSHWSGPLAVSGLYRRLYEHYGFDSPEALYLACGLLERLVDGLGGGDGDDCGQASGGEHHERHQRE